MAENWDPRKTWRRLRLEIEAAKNYPLSYAMYIGQTHRHAVIEQVLPALFHIKATAVLDDALDLWIAQNGHALRPLYRNDLNGRLTYMADNALITDIDKLHNVRWRRNRLAHEPGSSCGWPDLESDLAVMEAALVALNLVNATGALEHFAERSSVEHSHEPGVEFTRTFAYGVREDGIPALTISWTQNFFND